MIEEEKTEKFPRREKFFEQLESRDYQPEDFTSEELNGVTVFRLKKVEDLKELEQKAEEKSS